MCQVWYCMSVSARIADTQHNSPEREGGLTMTSRMKISLSAPSQPQNPTTTRKTPRITRTIPGMERVLDPTTWSASSLLRIMA